MFTFYKKHNNKLYNNLVNLSRNKYFYQEIKLFDDFETRVILLFFHFVIILKVKKNEDLKKNFQLLFDNIFQNIEVNIRELGYGDTKVNKTMKDLTKIFYDILTSMDKKEFASDKYTVAIINKYFNKNKKIDIQKTNDLAQYFAKFENFCFDLDVNNVLNGSINFNYR